MALLHHLNIVIKVNLSHLPYRDIRGHPVAVLQSSLRILENLISPPTLAMDEMCGITAPDDGLTVNARKWLQCDTSNSYETWASKMPQKKSKVDKNKCDLPLGSIAPPTAEQKLLRSYISILEEKRRHDHHIYLIDKYARIWRRKTLMKAFKPRPLKFAATWLKTILFNSSSRMARKLACALIHPLINKMYERKREMLDLLTGFLKYIGDAGEASEEFLILYRCLAEDTPWRQYLVLKGVLTYIADLLTAEIEKIHRLEETTLSSDLAQGYALRQLVELLAMFLDKPKIRQVYKGKLLGKKSRSQSQ